MGGNASDSIRRHWIMGNKDKSGKPNKKAPSKSLKEKRQAKRDKRSAS